jgi:large subunit ribosomal protein L23
MNAHQIISHPVSTEKTIRMMESQNKLVFVVHKKATRADIKKAFEELFKAQVASVRTVITTDGDKRAYVQLDKKTPAIDIATQLGLM